MLLLSYCYTLLNVGKRIFQREKLPDMTLKRNAPFQSHLLSYKSLI